MRDYSFIKAAEVGPDLQMVAEAAPPELAAAGEGGKPTRFDIVAYTGGKMRIRGFIDPVVVDLAGLTVSQRARPALLEHDREQRVGHTDKVEIKANRLRVGVVLSGTKEMVSRVVEPAANGFPWRISASTYIDKLVYIKPGAVAAVNGRTFKGPVYIVRKGRLAELSFVSLAADDDTFATIAAAAIAAAQDEQEETTMKTFEKWLEAKGFEPDKLDESQRETLVAAYEAGGQTPKPKKTEAGEPAGGTPKKTEVDEGGGPASQTPKKTDAGGEDIAAQAARAATEALRAERERTSKIEAACKGFEGNEQVRQLKAQAIGGEIELDTLQAKLLEIYRTGHAPAVITATGGGPAEAQVLEAALLLQGADHEREERLVSEYGEKPVEAARKRFRHGLGPKALLLEAAWAQGYMGRHFDHDPDGVMEAAASSMSLPTILGNVANKDLLEGFHGVEQVWREIAVIDSVRNFHQRTHMRMTVNGAFEQVGPDGELKHGTASETTYTNKAETFGQLFTLTRQDIINDDESALRGMPLDIGELGGHRLNSVLWAKFLDNAAFFTAARGNYAAGAGTALDFDALATARKMSAEIKDDKDKPIALNGPKKLLTPPALQTAAEQLMKSTTLTEGGGSSKSKVPTTNTMAGAFEPVTSVFLGTSYGISGSSDKAWYILGKRSKLGVIEVVFLNGKQVPTVERVDVEPNKLGISYRGYWDFGVSLKEYRMGLKMLGEAE